MAAGEIPTPDTVPVSRPRYRSSFEKLAAQEAPGLPFGTCDDHRATQ